jgi:hypothetical protein
MDNRWRQVLKEEINTAINRFLVEGVLIQADLGTKLNCKLNTNELKKMLKERSLSSSGKKGDMIQRLINNDPEGMSKAIEELTVLKCSDRGINIVNQYLANEADLKQKTEEKVFNHLTASSFKEAAKTVGDYESNRVFPRGIGVDWKNYESSTAVRMLIFYASNKVNLINFKKIDVKYVTILISQDSCNSCKSLKENKYCIEEAPELPHKNCTHHFGCRCSFSPIL